MPSTKPRRNVRIIESLQRYFGGRTHRPIRVDHSAAPTPKLRAADEDARLATAVLKFKELMSYVEGLPEADKQAILAAGGDACKAPQFVEVMEKRRQMYMGPQKLLAASLQLAADGEQEIADRFMAYAREEAAHDRTVAQLKPIALRAKPGPEHTFNPGLVELWGRKPDGSWRVRQPRHYIATARKLEKCFPERDYRTITIKDAIFFAKWLHESRVPAAAQGNHISNAKSMYAKAWHDMPDHINPFDRVEAIATYEQGVPGKFSYDQLRALVALIEAKRWGDNRIEKRHLAAYWLVMLAIYTGQRIGALASLRKSDIKEHAKGGVSFHYIAFRKEAVKQDKGEDKASKMPLHPDIESKFLAFVATVEGKDIFGAFGADEGWIVSNFPTLLRKNAAALGIELRDGVPVDADGRKLKQHSLRGTFHTAMTDARLSGDAQRILVGRKGKDVHESVYATDMGLALLYEDVCKMKPLG